MRRGIISSLVLHFAIFTLAYYGLPNMLDKQAFNDKNIITVEILPISEISNVKPIKVKPKPKPVKKAKLPDPVIKPKEKIKPIVKLKPKKEKVVFKKADITPQQKPKKEIKKPEEKPEKQLDFSEVLKSVEEFENKPNEQEIEPEDDLSEVTKFLSSIEENKYKPGSPLSQSERDAIKKQISSNWTGAWGSKNAKDMVVKLLISLARDGTVTEVENLEMPRYNLDNYYRAMVDSAIRAVYKSSPIKNLPPEKYDVKDGWRKLSLNFDPSEMLY